MIVTHYLDGTTITCSCCGGEKMAEIHARDKMVIMDGRHGRKHAAILTPAELLIRLSGTVTRDGVVQYVRTVFGE